jgi:transcriptional regulator
MTTDDRKRDLINQVAVAGLRDQGHSWQYIADGLGTTRQSAHGRYAEKVAS